MCLPQNSASSFSLLRKGPKEDPARPKEKGGLGGVVGYGWASACVGRSPKDQGHQPETNKDIIVADGHTVSNAPDLFRPPKLSGTGPG